VPDTTYDQLARDLKELGRAVRAPGPDDGLTVAVMTRVAELPLPRPRPARRVRGLVVSRRRVAAAVTLVLAALLSAPPVRAGLADWFGFAGVQVRNDPGPAPASTPTPPTAGSGLTLDEARRRVAFVPVVPESLGAPDGVEVSADDRVLSMSWSGGPDGVVRLDQFDGQLDYVFAKSAPGVRFTEVAGDFALWFDRPHEVVLIEDGGTRRTEAARLAGRTLIWQVGATTLRLEGHIGLVRATEIAESVAMVR
jgi:hypothetical protein